jgi:hypothetical protein
MSGHDANGNLPLSTLPYSCKNYSTFGWKKIQEDKKLRLLDFLEESLINLCNIKLVIKDILRDMSESYTFLKLPNLSTSIVWAVNLCYELVWRYYVMQL